MPSLRTGPGRSVCSWEANMCVEAHWCRRDGLSLPLTALLGLSISVYSILWERRERSDKSISHFFFSLVLWPCRSKKELSRWRVVSGRTYISTLGGSYVDRIVLNGNYDPNRNDYDIALMRLSSPISVGGQRVLSQKHTNRNHFFSLISLLFIMPCRRPFRGCFTTASASSAEWPFFFPFGTQAHLKWIKQTKLEAFWVFFCQVLELCIFGTNLLLFSAMNSDMSASLTFALLWRVCRRASFWQRMRHTQSKQWAKGGKKSEYSVTVFQRAASQFVCLQKPLTFLPNPLWLWQAGDTWRKTVRNPASTCNCCWIATTIKHMFGEATSLTLRMHPCY